MLPYGKEDLHLISDLLSLKKIGHTRFYSYLNDDEKLQNMNDWFEGKQQIMLATSGFLVGIDYPYVKYVIIHGFSYSISSYIQQSGRLARKKGQGISILNTSNSTVGNNKIGSSFFLLKTGLGWIGDYLCIQLGIQALLISILPNESILYFLIRPL
jgi:superfamily II DNA or RNA helicase